jgi:hypothetical protein
MSALTTPAQIQEFRVRALRTAVKMEVRGFTRRGRSACQIARLEFGLARNMSKQKVLDFLIAKCAEYDEAEANRIV